jgi:hypothetical protein
VLIPAEYKNVLLVSFVQQQQQANSKQQIQKWRELGQIHIKHKKGKGCKTYMAPRLQTWRMPRGKGMRQQALYKWGDLQVRGGGEGIIA